MRVLHIVHWLNSGLGAVADAIISEHKKAGVGSYLVVLEDDGAEVARYGREADAMLRLSMSRQPVRSFARLRRFVREANHDVIHSHSVTPMVLSALVGNGAVRVRTVHAEYPYLTSSGAKDAIKRAVERVFISRQSAVVTVSNDIVHRVQQTLGYENTIAIQNGISIPDSVTRRTPGKDWIIGAAGRLNS